MLKNIKKSKPNSNCIIDNISLLSVCEKKWKEFINAKKLTFNVKKKQLIFSENDQVTGIYFVCKGLIKVFKNGLANKIQIVRFSNDGDIIGHRGWNKEYMPISAMALEDSEILFINKDDFNLLLLNNPKLTYSFLDFFSNELFHSEIKMKNLSLMNIYEKLADSLLYLEDTFGKDKKGNLNIIITRKDLSYFAGISEKQVSKILSEWSNEKIIKLDKKSIFIKNKPYLIELIKGKILLS